MTNAPSNPYFAEVAEQWDEIRSDYFTEHMRDAAIDKAHLPPQCRRRRCGHGYGFCRHGSGCAGRSRHRLRCQPGYADRGAAQSGAVRQRGIP